MVTQLSSVSLDETRSLLEIDSDMTVIAFKRETSRPSATTSERSPNPHQRLSSQRDNIL